MKKNAHSLGNEASKVPMYNHFADLYDAFYAVKDYHTEVNFLHNFLTENRVKTVLDIGCGTGMHMSILEKMGYHCSGMDINQEMLNVAKNKVKGKLTCANMHDFQFNETFDACISMFAVFNHNLHLEEARNTLKCMSDHVKKNGIVVIDLYNPQTDGKKNTRAGKVERVMEWKYKPGEEFCLTNLKFIKEGLCTESQFPLKIFKISELDQLFEELNFRDIQYFENYTLNPGYATSKNLIAVLRK